MAESTAVAPYPSDIISMRKVLGKMTEYGLQRDPRYKKLESLIRSHEQAERQRNKGINTMTEEQTHRLRAQVQAFRLLSRGLAIPASMQDTLFRGRPAHIPSGPEITQRDETAVGKLSLRESEINSLPAGIPDVLKPKLDHEKRLIKLLAVQQRVRERVSQEMLLGRAESTAVRQDFAFPKPASTIATTTIATQLEAKSRESHVGRQKARHKEFLDAVVHHKERFDAFHTVGRAERRQKICRGVKQWHVNAEKMAALANQRKEQDRIRALKENDEEAYMRLIADAKNERLTTLLEQTDKFLMSISSLISISKGETTTAEAPREDTSLLVEPEKKGYKNEKYYRHAHKISERITRQPSIMTGGRLKEYQVLGLEWMVSLYNNNLNGILADEMGLGKTIQAISLVSYLVESKNDFGPYLIVVPLSTISNWVNELEKWCPTISKVVYKGQPNTRKKIASEMHSKKFTVCLTTYDFVIRDKSALSKFNWNYIIVDEGHRVKNKDAKLTTTLSQAYNFKRRLILTGTPLQNNLSELWALLNFLLPLVFKSQDTFEKWFNAPFEATGQKLELNEEETLLIVNRLHKVLRPFLLRRLKKEVEAQLPDKVERTIRCDMSALQKALYARMKSGAASAMGGGGAVKALKNTLMQLRKVCNHPYLFPACDSKHTDDMIIRTSGKFEVLDRLLPKFKAAGNRILIFSQMTTLMTVMEDFLTYRGYSYLRLDGNTKTEDRGIMLQKFNAADSPYFIFLLSTRAGGLGLNLQQADTVILFDSDWNPHADLQAQDRAHRIGQKHEVRIFRLITANSIEENILSRALEKLEMDAMVIGAGKFNEKSTQQERRELLEQILREESDDENMDIPDDNELNELLARRDKDSLSFGRMDEDRVRGAPAGKAALMTEEELNTSDMYFWLTAEYARQIKQEEQDNRVEMGRGHRVRKDVIYDDGLNEEQFLKLVENGADAEEVRAMLAKRAERRKQRLAEQAEENEQRKKRKKGEGSDEDSGSDSRPKKRARASASKEQGTVCDETAQMKLWDAVAAAEEEGRALSDAFMDLPPKDDFPDYYEKIEKPLSLNMVKKNIKRGAFRVLEDVRTELEVVFENARTYNEDGSEIFKDATALLRIVQKASGEMIEAIKSSAPPVKKRRGRPPGSKNKKTLEKERKKKAKKEKREEDDEEERVAEEEEDAEEGKDAAEDVKSEDAGASELKRKRKGKKSKKEDGETPAASGTEGGSGGKSEGGSAMDVESKKGGVTETPGVSEGPESEAGEAIRITLRKPMHSDAASEGLDTKGDDDSDEDGSRDAEKNGKTAERPDEEDSSSASEGPDRKRRKVTVRWNDVVEEKGITPMAHYESKGFLEQEAKEAAAQAAKGDAKAIAVADVDDAEDA